MDVLTNQRHDPSGCVFFIMFAALAYAVPAQTDNQSLVVSSSYYLQVYPGTNPTEEASVGLKSLYFALMMSFGGDFRSSGAIPGVQVALDQINSNPTLLPGYQLHYTLTDSQVCPAFNNNMDNKLYLYQKVYLKCLHKYGSLITLIQCKGDDKCISQKWNAKRCWQTASRVLYPQYYLTMASVSIVIRTTMGAVVRNGKHFTVKTFKVKRKQVVNLCHCSIWVLPFIGCSYAAWNLVRYFGGSLIKWVDSNVISSLLESSISHNFSHSLPAWVIQTACTSPYMT